MKKIAALFILFFCGTALLNADMNPLRNPGKKFTQVLGIDLINDRLDKVIDKLGKSYLTTKGDAAEYEGKVCYFAGDDTIIEFTEWELGSGCVLRKPTKKDNSCARIMIPNVIDKDVEINGLKLGLSKAAIIKILGEPKTKSADKWIYDFQGQAKDKKIANRFGSDEIYYWQFLIKVSFDKSLVSRLELSPTIQ
ncbi:MAG: hypothetical protein JXA73_13310 [Acidobacteria bacterium]|nr:hypothetical protein [Acidobacteriota bacterium]